MRDPHVQRMHYDVGSGKGISYRNPESISFSNHLGTFDLSDGKLQIVPTEDFSAEDEARGAIEPFLRAWEIQADLTSRIGMIRFNFERAEVVDRNPAPPGSSTVIQPKAVELMISVTGMASIHVTCSDYPQPPEKFRITPEVQHAYDRWFDYRSGKEPLQSMAYFVLTLLVSSAGNWEQAARSFQIDLRVLKMISKLSTIKGDERTARKADPQNRQFQELSGSEKQWLENAIIRIIHRLGEHASGGSLSRISLQDLPSF